MNLSHKSTLAKLLARENIQVRHGNYETAWFDVKQRVLGLPLWKDKGKDVYDLFVGHEIGHALFTPTEGWHNEAFENRAVPKDYLNVVEDIRIERAIQRKYPGLVACFHRGYKTLSDEDFFGIRGKNVNEMHFMNRLNLKSKMGDLIDVQFTDEEQYYFDLAMSVETWDDVVRVCKILHDYMNKLKEEGRVVPQFQTIKMGDLNQGDSNTGDESGSSLSQEELENTNDIPQGTDSLGSDSDDKADENSKKATTSNSPKSDVVAGDHPDDSNKEAKADDTTEKEAKSNSSVASAGSDSDIDRIDTDREYRKNESMMNDEDDNGLQPLIYHPLTAEHVDDMIISHEVLRKSRAIKAENHNWRLSYDSEYKQFMDETSKYVALMAKEFEMRKAAYQYSRSQTSRSGSLDVTKLYNYKFSDDIFRRVTRLADAKSHGMIMLVDNSGSMQGIMSGVLRQIITLSLFCKKVNIPFQVYTFTESREAKACDDRMYTKRIFLPGEIKHENIVLVDMLNSSLSKTEFNEAIRTMFNQSCGRYFGHSGYESDVEDQGGTPLNEALMAMPHIFKRFRAKHNVQKLIFNCITDGDPNSPSVTLSDITLRTNRQRMVTFPEKNVTALNDRILPRELMKYLRDHHNVKTIGYFLADSRRAFNSAVAAATGSWDREGFIKARKSVSENKFVSYDNALGYDRYFILNTDDANLDTAADEFNVESWAKPSDVRRAFMKYAGSKRKNRVLASQFAEIIS